MRPGSAAAAAASAKLSAGASMESGSSGCAPAMASSISAASRALRAMGPSTISPSKGRCLGPCATRPGLGRKPKTLQKLAGMRRLPPRSEPVASHTCPVASATAEPPEEPPQVLSVFHGLRVLPKTSLKVLAPAPNSGVLDLPITIAPRRSSVSIMMSERGGHVVGVDRRAPGRAHALHRHQVLDRDGHTAEPAGRALGGGVFRHDAPGVRPRAVDAERRDRVEVRVGRRDPLGARVHQLQRRDLAPPQQVHHLGSAEAPELAARRHRAAPRQAAGGVRLCQSVSCW